MKLHFILKSYQLPGPDFESWNPDLQPQLFADGIGHNILELAKRLQARGHKITMGPKVISTPDIVIFFKRYLTSGLLDQFSALFISNRYPTVHIRSDLPSQEESPVKVDLEVVPNKLMQKKRNQIFLLPCIQRGLIASNRELNSPIEKSAIKCNRVNLPYEIYDLRDKLKALSPPISLRMDVWEKGEISLNNNWHDFESIDVSFILRDRNFEKINENNEVCTEKPPTRLINAWSAGTIPIVDRTPSYAELISNGQDGFIVDNIADVIKVVNQLNSNIEILEEVRKAIRAKQQTLNQEVIVSQWEEHLLVLSRKKEKSFLRKMENVFLFMIKFVSQFPKRLKEGTI